MKPDLIFDPQPTRHRGRRLFVALVAVACAAFTVKETVDLLGWRDIGARARAIGMSPSFDTQTRIDAMTVGCRDTRAWILALRQIAEGGGDESVHARNFLASIEAAHREPLPPK